MNIEEDKEYENFKNRLLQRPITFLTEENLDKLEEHCRKAIRYERGIEHKVVLELLERYKEFLAEREEDKKKIAELEAKLEFYQWGDLDNLKFEEYMKEFIPKQKVKEILIEIQEEYNKLDKEIDKQIKDKNKDYYKCKENIAIMQTLAYCRDKFEGLLEEK